MLPTSPSAFSISNPPSPGLLGDARRIDVRPRNAGMKTEESMEEGEVSDQVLNFSCPSCLHMLGTMRQSIASSVRCPECSATVMPPQIVNMTGGGKTALPPPRKSGTHMMRKR